MLFRSNFAAFTKVIRHEIEVPHPTLPKILEKIPALRAEFGQVSEEYMYESADGSVSEHADIRGHFFDSVIAQEQNRWTDDERKEVEKSLLDLANTWPEAVQLVSEPAAKIPWPTYDETDPKDIPAFALATGLVVETLKYEFENKKRQEVMKPLQEKLPEIEAAAAEESEELAVA